MITSCWILLKIKNVSYKSSEENHNTHFMFKFLRKSCRLWGNMKKFSGAGHATGNNIIGRMHFTCCLTKAQIHTNTHTHTHTHTHKHTQNMYYRFSTAKFFYTKAPQCYLIRTLPILFKNVSEYADYGPFQQVAMTAQTVNNSLNVLHNIFWTELLIVPCSLFVYRIWRHVMIVCGDVWQTTREEQSTRRGRN
jgi:hypothetical protein